MSILQPLDAAILFDAGLVTAVSNIGTRRIHKRRLNSFSDEDDDPTPFPPQPVAQPDGEYFVTIPDQLMSEATLVHMGYREDIAANIWGRWVNWSPGPVVREIDNPGDDGINLVMEFIDFATGHAEGRGRLIDVDFRNGREEWLACFEACGINKETQDALMDPLYNSIRETESCVFWILDTMKMRYRGLEQVQAASIERDRAIQRDKSRPKGSKQEGGNTGSRSISATQRQSVGIQKETALSSSAILGGNAPGTLTLWKGVDQARINGLFNESREFKNIRPLISDSKTDFLIGPGYYFAVDKEIAMRYAAWAKRRDAVVSVVVVRLQVPNSSIKSLSEKEIQRVYFPSAEFKELVFQCRVKREQSKALRKFHKAMLIIGSLMTRPNKWYAQLESSDQITEKELVKRRDGGVAIQYAWSADRGGATFLETHGDIKVFPLTAAEHKQWEAEEMHQMYEEE